MLAQHAKTPGSGHGHLVNWMYCSMAVIQAPRKDLIARGSEVQGDLGVVWNQSKTSNLCQKQKLSGKVSKNKSKNKQNLNVDDIYYINMAETGLNYKCIRRYSDIFHIHIHIWYIPHCDQLDMPTLAWTWHTEHKIITNVINMNPVIVYAEDKPVCMLLLLGWLPTTQWN